MNESTYGIKNGKYSKKAFLNFFPVDLDSILCKSGFIKTYSKPSNPGRAKNFTNPPDYQIYFEQSTGNNNNSVTKNHESHSLPKNKTGLGNLT